MWKQKPGPAILLNRRKVKQHKMEKIIEQFKNKIYLLVLKCCKHASLCCLNVLIRNRSWWSESVRFRTSRDTASPRYQRIKPFTHLQIEPRISLPPQRMAGICTETQHPSVAILRAGASSWGAYVLGDRERPSQAHFWIHLRHFPLNTLKYHGGRMRKTGCGAKVNFLTIW